MNCGTGCHGVHISRVCNYWWGGMKPLPCQKILLENLPLISLVWCAMKILAVQILCSRKLLFLALFIKRTDSFTVEYFNTPKPYFRERLVLIWPVNSCHKGFLIQLIYLFFFFLLDYVYRWWIHSYSIVGTNPCIPLQLSLVKDI